MFTLELTNNNQFKKFINGLDIKTQGINAELLYIWIKNEKLYWDYADKKYDNN